MAAERMGIDPMEHKWRVDTEVILEIYGPEQYKYHLCTSHNYSNTCT